LGYAAMPPTVDGIPDIVERGVSGNFHGTGLGVGLDVADPGAVRKTRD
jgi:hypothetical protein